MSALVSALAVTLLLANTQMVAAQTFHPTDPLLEDDDRLIDVTTQPEEIELSDLYDRFSHIFHTFGDPPFPIFVEAQNIKALFMTVWCPDSRSVESNCGIPRG